MGQILPKIKDLGRQNTDDGFLAVIGTPLGNLSDATNHLRQILDGGLDILLCEDTRRSGELLSAFSIKGLRLERFDQTVEKGTHARWVEAIRGGKRVGLVSDGGLPGICDPGADLIRSTREAGLTVRLVAGPSAISCAFAMSGFKKAPWVFLGFFPRAERDAEEQLERLMLLQDASLFWFESPKRLLGSLKTLESFAERAEAKATYFLAHEMTKIHEGYFGGSYRQVVDQCEAIASKGELKGEWVLGIEFERQGKNSLRETKTCDDLLEYLFEQGVSVSTAAGAAQRVIDLPRKEIYSRAQKRFEEKFQKKS